MIDKKQRFNRFLEKDLLKLLKSGYSGLILGPRQVGKTSLVEYFLNNFKNTHKYFLQNPKTRADLEKEPEKIIKEVEAMAKKPIVFVDEAQKAPEIFDAIQYLLDKKQAQFILTGSSARKLRRSGANLLPGRIKRYYLDPLLWGELGLIKENNIKKIAINNINKDCSFPLEDFLVFGSLPGIITLPKKEQEDFLKSYALIYLNEEIRAESLSRKIGAFSRFLELAAQESGTSPNYSKLSNEAGISTQTIKDYYQLLSDTLVVEIIEPFLKNARKRILASPKYYFFDLGVRNVLARWPLSKDTANVQKGVLFEHFVMLEIIRRVRALNKNYKINYWRTSGGAEVDCVIDFGSEVIPIEIKSGDNARLSDLKGLKNFLEEYSSIAKTGYVITTGERKQKLSKNIIALPWNCL
ncbi:ATP-binding protein [Patescibacteria group bacterium]|nr:ATP-binding protein [Patescibacteria group bacterium]MBU2264310.1 ATP-binding protein [Patescibacteria group bacterium]